MMNSRRWTAAVAAMAVALVASACVPIWKEGALDERVTANERAIAENSDLIAQHGEDIAGLRDDVEALRGDVDELADRLDSLAEAFEECDCGGMRLAAPVYFDFDESEIRPQERPVLDKLASTLQRAESAWLLTVEGFADPRASESYNIRLGQQRADAVKQYLVEQGVNGDRIKTVSYGEARNRQVNPGAQGPGRAGLTNRRATFVLDWAARVDMVDETGAAPGEEG